MITSFIIHYFLAERKRPVHMHGTYPGLFSDWTKYNAKSCLLALCCLSGVRDEQTQYPEPSSQFRRI